MSIPEQIARCLRRGGVSYVTNRHELVYTAEAVAALEPERESNVVKTVIVSLDDDLAMVVLPAKFKVDFDALVRETGARESWLAQEGDFAHIFVGIDTGAMPPLGNLWGMRVYVDRSLERKHEITFRAGTHVDTITLKYADFKRIVNPIPIECASWA